MLVIDCLEVTASTYIQLRLPPLCRVQHRGKRYIQSAVGSTTQRAQYAFEVPKVKHIWTVPGHP